MDRGPRRPLGRSALSLPPLVLGGMFREAGSRTSEIERALDYALDRGVGAIDTAPLYGFGEAEALLGAWLRGRRDRLVLMTKVGLRWDGDFGDVLFTQIVEGRRRTVRRDARPDSIRRDVEASLARLECETLDLVQIHQRDHRTPLCESLGALMRLRDEGKLRAIGVSNFSARDLAEAERLAGPDGLASTQNPYSLLDRRVESEILPTARGHGIGLLAYSPLARGLLAGRAALGAAPIRDGRRNEALFQARNRQRVHAAIEQGLLPIARERGVSIGAVALAWLIAQPGVGAAIVGAQDEAQVAAALPARDLVLTAEERSAIERPFAALHLDPNAGLPLARRLVRRLRRIGHGLQRVRERVRRSR